MDLSVRNIKAVVYCFDLFVFNRMLICSIFRILSIPVAERNDKGYRKNNIRSILCKISGRIIYVIVQQEKAKMCFMFCVCKLYSILYSTFCNTLKLVRITEIRFLKKLWN